MGFAMCEFLLVLQIVVLAIPGSAQGPRGESLRGWVRIAGSMRAPERADVRILSRGVLVDSQILLDGTFEFSRLPEGQYTVVVDAPGYASTTTTVIVPRDFAIMVEVHTRSSRDGKASTVSAAELQVPRSARQEFERAQKKVRQNDCKGALENLHKAAQLFSGYAEAHSAMGDCYSRLDNFDQAKQEFRRAVALTPSLYPVLSLADLLVREGKLSEADELLTDAIQRNPSDGDGYAGLAQVRFEEQRFDDAEKLSQKAHEQAHHNANVHLFLAKLYLHLGEASLLAHEFELYVREAKPNAVRDLIQKMLANPQTAGAGR